MSMAKIKRGDMVKVIAGKDKDKEGKVLRVDTKNHKVLVEGINVVKKHTKPNAADQAGGIDVDKRQGIMSADIKKRLRFTAAYMRGKFAAAVKSNKRSDA